MRSKAEITTWRGVPLWGSVSPAMGLTGRERSGRPRLGLLDAGCVPLPLPIGVAGAGCAPARLMPCCGAGCFPEELSIGHYASRAGSLCWCSCTYGEEKAAPATVSCYTVPSESTLFTTLLTNRPSACPFMRDMAAGMTFAISFGPVAPASPTMRRTSASIASSDICGGT